MSCLRRGARAALTLLALLIAGAAVVPTPAHAFLMYLEGGLGPSMVINHSSYFPGTTQAFPFLGPAWAGGLTFVFGNGNNAIDIHVGAKYRAVSSNIVGGAGFTNYQIMTVYPELKVQMSILYLSVGMTPLVMTRAQDYYGFDGLQLRTGYWAYSAEFGILYPWTPMFSIGGSVTAQMHSTGFVGQPLSPCPAIDAMLFMRFYFWKQDISAGTAGSKSEITPNEYKGWRYPGGWNK